MAGKWIKERYSGKNGNISFLLEKRIKAILVVK